MLLFLTLAETGAPAFRELFAKVCAFVSWLFWSSPTLLWFPRLECLPFCVVVALPVFGVFLFIAVATGVWYGFGTGPAAEIDPLPCGMPTGAVGENEFMLPE